MNNKDKRLINWLNVEIVISIFLIISCGYSLYWIYNLPYWKDNFTFSPMFFLLIGWSALNIWRLLSIFNLKMELLFIPSSEKNESLHKVNNDKNRQQSKEREFSEIPLEELEKVVNKELGDYTSEEIQLAESIYDKRAQSLGIHSNEN